MASLLFPEAERALLAEQPRTAAPLWLLEGTAGSCFPCLCTGKQRLIPAGPCARYRHENGKRSLEAEEGSWEAEKGLFYSLFLLPSFRDHQKKRQVQVHLTDICCCLLCWDSDLSSVPPLHCIPSNRRKKKKPGLIGFSCRGSQADSAADLAAGPHPLSCQ